MSTQKGKSKILPTKTTSSLHAVPPPVSKETGKKKQTAKEILVALSLIKKDAEKRKTEKTESEKQALERTRDLEKLNRQLIFQNEEKEKRAAELVIANKELAFQNEEKERRAAELVIANKELAFQNEEKEKRAEELIIANKELAFQNEEKEKRAEELIIANKELAFQNEEKEKRAGELIIANKELAFQNEEKEKRAGELIIANKELAFQNEEKEKRAGELIIANKELAFQNEEKEKRAGELLAANKELQVFTFISSHDLKEPLRKIQVFAALLLEKEAGYLSANGIDYLNRTRSAARQMQTLIDALQVYSDTNLKEQTFKRTSLNTILLEVIEDMAEYITEKNSVIQVAQLCYAYINHYQFTQVFRHLMDNALKFSRPGIAPHITIRSRIANGSRLQKENLLLEKRCLSPSKDYCHIHFADNGIGFEPKYREKIFQVFQKLHLKGIYKGTGIGLPIVKKIIQNHHGYITATGVPDEGAIFDIYIPAERS